jgi:hypothetical protein
LQFPDSLPQDPNRNGHAAGELWLTRLITRRCSTIGSVRGL